ncbi:histidine kinase dimerization/phospho-acceptor domain-containing protein [Embleya sp. NPDC127516]|uniref:histidine kinase dimerization/phospho-acceptor domain-containing protein n=1 Tax=Embleya sp. NPDC127516 TaxID=3363990 RepID=UPI003823EC0F
MASHDLQEPLHKVSSFTQLLKRRYGGQLDERADQYIDFAVDGANRMQGLINYLLEFSRVGRFHNALRSVPWTMCWRRPCPRRASVSRRPGRRSPTTRCRPWSPTPRRWACSGRTCPGRSPPRPGRWYGPVQAPIAVSAAWPASYGGAPVNAWRVGRSRVRRRWRGGRRGAERGRRFPPGR